MNFAQQDTYEFEFFIKARLVEDDARDFPSSKRLTDNSGRQRAMRSLLIAIPALLMVSFGAWAFLALIVLEH
jgi:hypothetical protein